MLTQNQKQQQNMERPSAPVFIFDLTGVYGLLCIWHGGGGDDPEVQTEVSQTVRFILTQIYLDWES